MLATTSSASLHATAHCGCGRPARTDGDAAFPFPSAPNALPADVPSLTLCRGPTRHLRVTHNVKGGNRRAQPSKARLRLRGRPSLALSARSSSLSFPIMTVLTMRRWATPPAGGVDPEDRHWGLPIPGARSDIHIALPAQPEELRLHEGLEALPKPKPDRTGAFA